MNPTLEGKIVGLVCRVNSWVWFVVVIFLVNRMHSCSSRETCTLSNLAVKCTPFFIEMLKCIIGLLTFPQKNYMWFLVLFMCFISSVTRDKSGMTALTFHKNSCKSMILFMPDHLYSGEIKLCENSCSIISCICLWPWFCHQPLLFRRSLLLPSCHLKVSENLKTSFSC